MSDSSEAKDTKQSYPTSFGRGWIPVELDIGLPDDDCTDLREWASASSPLPGSGSGGRGSAPRVSLGGKSRRSGGSGGFVAPVGLSRAASPILGARGRWPSHHVLASFKNRFPTPCSCDLTSAVFSESGPLWSAGSCREVDHGG